MRKNNRFLKTIIGVGLLLAGLIGAVVIFKTKSPPVRQKMSAMIPVVETTELSTVSTSVTVSCMGTVIADREVALQAEVSGLVTGIMPGLVEGAFVRKGDVLLTVDPRDYELAVRQAQAALHSAQSSLRLEEGQQAVALYEMDLVGKDVPVDEAYRDLMLRAPQLKTAEADVEAAQADLDTAQLNLERTKVTAPFDAVVQTVSVDEGDYAASSKTLVELVAADRFFVRASLPVGSLSMFPDIEKTEFPAEVRLTDGAVKDGTLYKLLPDLSEEGRMARVLVSVEDPLSADNGRPMLLGEYVRVNLSGKRVDGVSLIDRSDLHDGSVLWMIDAQSRLHIVPAEIVQGYTDQVLVRAAVSKDWKLVASDISAPVDGMELHIYSAQEEGRE
jgi:RND family efflux transporter MFP subunit